MKIKKSKAAILTVATAALIASLVYDKNYNKNKEKLNDEENESNFTIK